MKNAKRVLALLLCLMMVITAVPMGAVADSVKAFAAELTTASTADATLQASLNEAKEYIDGITINSSSNDPATVVKNFKTHFTWDNEKRENSKDYLFDWSYYNGVVFEGLEYLYENSGDEAYKDYVMEYMSSLIDSDGSWATCTNNSSKQCAGYNSTHGADCYKTASLLLDAYEMTKDSRYLTMAETLYADLDTAASKYSLKNAGNNYRHTWASDPSPDLWLDGLYMILPFRAEYAKHIGDTEELDLIVSRLQWVSDNMYNSSKGLFYHAADSATSNSGTYWLRSMGWYAAAMVDVMDSMEGTNLETMKAQLKKFVDGMKACQNASNGMWLNNMGDDKSDSNPYETSGTALICYAVMKAVNEGWLDSSYADMAILAFNGICNEKLSGTTLTDICYIGNPGSSNSTFKDNEGKGVGPFIMFYAEMLEYVNKQAETPEASPSPEATATPAPSTEPTPSTSPETPSSENIEINNTTITVDGATNVEGSATVKDEEENLVNEFAEEKNYAEVLLYDISATLAEGAKATLTFPIPEGWDADRIVGISVENGAVKEIEGTYESGKFTFTVDHFSAKGIALTATNVETNGGNWVTITEPTNGTTTYTYTRVDTIEYGKAYVIVDDSNPVALGGTFGAQSLSLNSDKTTATSTTELSQWTFSRGYYSNTYYISNNGNYITYYDSNYTTTSNQSSLTVTDNGDYFTIKTSSTNRTLCYRNNKWQRSSSNNTQYVYLYELTKTETEGGTDGLYGAIVGDKIYTVPYGTSEADAKTTILAGITACTSNSNTATTGTVISDNDLTVSFNNYVANAEDGGTYEATITHKETGKVLGTVTVNVAAKPKINVTKVVINPASATVERDSTGIIEGATLSYTYLEGTQSKTTTIDLTIEMLNDDIFKVNKNGTYTGKVTYMGVDSENDFTLNVVNKTGVNDFPTYPNAGSVDVDKVAHGLDFQNTGLARVELSTSGIPVQVGVDAVLTIDISNSMAWATGTKTYNANNKLDEVMTAVKNFAKIFLADNEDGSKTQNTITIVTFAGYDAEHWNGSGSYIDSVRTLVTATSNIDVVNEIANGTYFTAAEDITISYIPENEDQNDVENVTSEDGANRGDTNYDYAFWQTNKAIEDGNLGSNNKEIHVLFMTDGCASNYNNYYYRTSNAGYYYLPGTSSAYTAYNNTTQTTGTGWTNLILNTLIPNNGGNIYAKNLYENGIDGMYAVGFDMEYGSFAGIGTWDTNTDWEEVFNEIVSKSVTDEEGNGLIPVTAASDTETLNKFYSNLATELRYAATNAYFEDQMGDAFELKMAPTALSNAGGIQKEITVDTSITVTTHPVYTKSQLGKTVTFTKNGETVTHEVGASDIGKAYGDGTTLERVTFTSSTAATSNVLTDANIIKNGVICAKYFYYNTTKSPVTINGITIPAETFHWNIGTINETQFTLSYVVYLTGSMDGKAPPSDSYYTNNYATLYYTNWVENEVFQSVPSPSMPWGGANVSYAFYLVNDDGTPLASNGTETNIINAYKVTQPVLHKVMNLNSGETVKLDAIADDVLPEGYELFAPEAVYEVTVLSGDGAGSWEITGDPNMTTYVTGYTNKLNEYLNTQAVSDTSYDYTHTTVYFAVKWVIGTVPDTVVIDFGLPVDIDVLANDMFGSAGTLVGLGLTSYEGYKNEGQLKATALGKDENSLKYGSAKIEGTEVRYTPESMEMPSYDKFSYEVRYENVNTGNFEFYSGDVTVIPATTIYYEDSFVDLSSYTWDYNENGWSEVTEEADAWTWSQVGTTVDATQAEDRPGYYSLSQIDANYIYGFDKAYENMSTYSMGSAIKAHVDYDNYAEATFNFYGTGFDVISLTSNKTGNMVVEVYNAAGVLEKSHVVDTYYGMDTDGSLIQRDEDTIWQVPVMKVSGLTYGMYTAVIRVQYADIFDHGQYGAENSYDFYLDAIRIYDPAGSGDQLVTDKDNDGIKDADDVTINDIYVQDKEAWPRYQEVRNNIIAAETFGEITVEGENGTTTKVDGVVFIDSNNEVGKAQLADYVSYGPNNEVYLANGQAIAFEVEVPANVADVQVALKVANGDSVTYTINGKQYTTNSATDLYRSILAEAKSGTITIQNVSGGILSITNIKTTHTSEPVSASAFGVRMFMSRASVNAVLAELNAEDEIIDDTTSTPEIDDTTSVPEVDDTVSTPEEDTTTSIPETSEPEVNKPETSQPETSEPETSKPEANQPETSKPETNQPETSEPETSEPEVNEPEAEEPAEDDEAEDKESDAKAKLEEAIKKATEKAEKVLKQAAKAAKTISKAISKYLKSILN